MGQIRRFWGIAVLATAVLVGCQSAPPVAVVEGVSPYQVFIAGDDLGLGRQRLPLILYDGPNIASGVTAVEAFLYDIATEPPQAVWQGVATGYTDYSVPYWVVNPDIPAAGNWGLGLAITGADGLKQEATAIVGAAADTEGPSVGDKPPASLNRTLSTVSDIAVLTSAVTPRPELYALTVAEALASGRPTVVTFTTPAYCQTALCAPVLDSVTSVYDDLADTVNFIHLEIYKDFQALTVADEVTEWNLPSEPWTFVMDSQGVITARLSGPVSPRELTAALEALP